MKHFTSPKFWALYGALPADVRVLADKNYELLKSDSRHPSLHFKKTGDLWSVRVGAHYRALATEVEGGVYWFWIGTHAEYDTSSHNRAIDSDTAREPLRALARARHRGR